MQEGLTKDFSEKCWFFDHFKTMEKKPCEKVIYCLALQDVCWMDDIVPKSKKTAILSSKN